MVVVNKLAQQWCHWDDYHLCVCVSGLVWLLCLDSHCHHYHHGSICIVWSTRHVATCRSSEPQHGLWLWLCLIDVHPYTGKWASLLTAIDTSLSARLKLIGTCLLVNSKTITRQISANFKAQAHLTDRRLYRPGLREIYFNFKSIVWIDFSIFSIFKFPNIPIDNLEEIDTIYWYVWPQWIMKCPSLSPLPFFGTKFDLSETRGTARRWWS